MANGRRVATLGELARPDGWVPVRRAFGITGFGVNAWHAESAGGPLVPEHDEDAHEELYLVVSGHATFTVDGEMIDAPAGTLVMVADPREVRAATAVLPDTTVLAIAGQPGAPFMTDGWEANRELAPLLEEGRWQEAADRFRQALTEFPDGSLLYNLACAEAQLGQLDAALGHLTAVISYSGVAPGNSSRVRQLIAEETLLTPLKGDPRFDELISPGQT